jgi:hypothetical protein
MNSAMDTASNKKILGTQQMKGGPVRIQYERLVPIYVFSEMKLCTLLISKTELSCSASRPLHTHKSVKDLYISRISLSILLQQNMWADPGNFSKFVRFKKEYYKRVHRNT